MNTTRMSTKQKLNDIYVEKKEILSPSGNYRMVETPSGCFGVGEVKRWMMNNPNICLAIPEERNSYIDGHNAMLAIVRKKEKTSVSRFTYSRFTARVWVSYYGCTQTSCVHSYYEGQEFAVGDIASAVNYTLWERV